MDWVSVDDRLPPDYEKVIVSGGIAYLRKGVWMTITAEAWPGKPIQWNVTHWMPFPGFPIDQQDDGSVMDWLPVKDDLPPFD